MAGIRGLIGRWGLAFAAVAVSLCAAEGALRLFIPSELVENSPIHTLQSPYGLGFYDLNPGSTGLIYGKPYRINSAGLRGKDASEAPARGRLRIAAMGDSHTFGYGVNEEETYPQELEKQLRRAGADAEVLNFGVWGYGFRQYPETLEKKVLRFHPDAVVLQVLLNDALDASDEAVSRRHGPWLFEEVRNGGLALYANFHLAKLAAPAVQLAAYSLLRRFGVEDWMVSQNLRGLESFRHGGAEWKRGQEDILDMQRVCRRNGIDLYLVIFPSLVKLDGGYWFADFHRAFREFCGQNGIPCLDMYEALYGQDLSQQRVNLIDYHPNAYAYRLMAGKTFERWGADLRTLAQRKGSSWN